TLSFFCSFLPRAPIFTIFPYTTLFRSGKIKLTDSVHIGERAWRTQGSRMFIEVNSDVPLDDLFRGIIIGDVRVDLNEHARALSTDRKSTRLNSSHVEISYAVFCLKKKK